MKRANPILIYTSCKDDKQLALSGVSRTYNENMLQLVPIRQGNNIALCIPASVGISKKEEVLYK